MPIITVQANLLTLEARRELVHELTQTAARIMALPPQSIVVVLECRPAEDYAVGGVLLSDREPAQEPGKG